MSPDLIPAAVPRPAALVRDFVNTLDHELGTDELATPAGLTGFLMSQDLLDAGRADEEQLARAVALRSGLHQALELNHADAPASVVALDDVLAHLPVRLRWTADGVVAAPAEDGVAGALARVGLAALEAARPRSGGASRSARSTSVSGPTTTTPRTGRGTTASTAAATSSRPAPTGRGGGRDRPTRR